MKSDDPAALLLSGMLVEAESDREIDRAEDRAAQAELTKRIDTVLVEVKALGNSALQASVEQLSSAMLKQIDQARNMETAALIKVAGVEATMTQMAEELKALRARPAQVAPAAPIMQRSGKVRAIVREVDPNGRPKVVDIDLGTTQ